MTRRPIDHSIRGLVVAVLAIVVMTARAGGSIVTFTVTSTADTASAGTLRQAVLDANGSAATDVRIDIDLPDGSEITLTSDLPVLTHPAVQINNIGTANAVAVDGNGFFRIFQQSGVDPSVSVNGLELRDARMDATGVSGGGACLYTTGRALISDSRFSNCQAINGSGAAVHTLGNLFVEDSVFADNSVFHDGSDRGGAVYCAGDDCSIRGSTFEGNRVLTQLATQTDRGGGAAALFGEQITIEDSLFIDNLGPGRGGALYLVPAQADASVDISRSLFRRNEGGEGGALWMAGSQSGQALSVSLSSFDRNSATLRGPAIVTSTVPEIDLDGNVFYLQDSSNNSEIWGTVFVFGNSTRPSTVRLDFNTFVGDDENSVLFEANEGGSPGDVVVARMHANVFDQRAANPACREELAQLVAQSGEFNVVSDDSCTGSIAVGSQVDVDPALHEAVQRPDRTLVYPRTDSPAIDLVISETLVPCSGQTDLGGSVRPLDGDGSGFGNCDAGALERNVGLFSDRFEN